MVENRWQSKADALLLLAKDQAGKPEGELASQKLKEILRDHPEARQYKPLQAFMMSDLGEMKRKGISTDGSWTGRDLGDALALMVQDYRSRLVNHKPPIVRLNDRQ